MMLLRLDAKAESLLAENDARAACSALACFAKA